MSCRRPMRPLCIAALLLGTMMLLGCGSGSTTTVMKKRKVVTAVASTPTHTPTIASQQYTTYQGPGYTAQIPVGWTTESDQADKGSYVESVFRDPANPNTSITIDITAGVSDTPVASASTVRADTSRTPGYQEIDFSPSTVAGSDAVKWVFDVSGDQRVDYFFNECAGGLAVLGSTSPNDFQGEEPVFDSVVQSVTGDCASSTSTTSVPPVSTQPPPVSGTSFCDTRSCIDNFYNGDGYIVQCNDGMWSHSGGIQGACSYHGGVRG